DLVRTREPFARPQTLGLDFGIGGEHRARGNRQAEIDGVAVVFAGKAQPQADGPLANRALDRVLAGPDRAPEAFRARPERRADPALGGERLDPPALSDVGQKPERPVEARFAAAIGAGHDVQRPQPDPDVPEGAIPSNGKPGDHWPRILPAPSSRPVLRRAGLA